METVVKSQLSSSEINFKNIIAHKPKDCTNRPMNMHLTLNPLRFMIFPRTREQKNTPTGSALKIIPTRSYPTPFLMAKSGKKALIKELFAFVMNTPMHKVRRR